LLRFRSLSRAFAFRCSASCSFVTSARRIDRGEIEVEHGVVTLNGSVPNLASKRLAGVLAWWAPGSRDVVNGTTVEPPEADAPIQIEEAVRIALEKDSLQMPRKFA